VKFSFQLVKCGRCGKPRGLTHTCHSQRRAPARAKLAPKARVTSKCGTCGKAVTNPLTHTCAVKTDFRKRAAAAKRGRPKARAGKPRRVTVARPAAPKKATHSYSACRDEACGRQACTAYRDGFGDGVASAESP
jgi:hypothetical protein